MQKQRWKKAMCLCQSLHKKVSMTEKQTLSEPLVHAEPCWKTHALIQHSATAFSPLQHPAH